MAPTFQQDVHRARKNRLNENHRRVLRILRELGRDVEDAIDEVRQRHAAEASAEGKQALQMEHDRLVAVRHRLDRRREASLRKRDERLQALVPEERRASRKSTRPTQRSQRPSS